MSESNTQQVARYGQSLWYDNISRDVLSRGLLARMIAEDGVAGVTSNPTIFMKAIAETADYDADIRLGAGRGETAEAIVRELMIGDIRQAADLLRPVYERTGGGDGFVSLECDPHLAHDEESTVAQARELWRLVDRPNLMIKVPGTPAGGRAGGRILEAGINVNFTLLFSPDHYRRVALACIEGLERRLGAGQPLAGVSSVASFFLSRIDGVVDRRLDAMAGSAPESERQKIGGFRGETAVAVAKVTYGIFRELFFSERFDRLAAAGAAIQRPLWASTGTKDPAYSDVKYVESLIGPHTVNTLPQATLDAFRDHGRAAETITAGLAQAPDYLRRLGELGIDMNPVYAKLQEDGVKAFTDSWDELMAAVRLKMA